MKILVVVDVQDEFEEFIQFDLVEELKDYANEFDKLYQVWDSHEADAPTHTFPNQVKTVKKLFGKNHFSEEVRLFIEEAKNSTEEGKLFKLSNGNGYLVRVDNNHDWFYINPEIYDMIEELKGNDITICGGADNECLEDVIVAIKTFGINVFKDEKYIYSAKTSNEDSIKERKVYNFTQFVNENYNSVIDCSEYWDYGDIVAIIHKDINNVKNWLNNYGDYNKTEEITTNLNTPVGCLKNINVNEDNRGHGYGNEILEYFIDKCIDEDVQNIILVADLVEEQVEGFDLVKWYESKGFEIINNINGNPVMKLTI